MKHKKRTKTKSSICLRISTLKKKLYFSALIIINMKMEKKNALEKLRFWKQNRSVEKRKKKKKKNINSQPHKLVFLFLFLLVLYENRKTNWHEFMHICIQNAYKSVDYNRNTGALLFDQNKRFESKKLKNVYFLHVLFSFLFFFFFAIHILHIFLELFKVNKQEKVVERRTS